MNENKLSKLSGLKASDALDERVLAYAKQKNNLVSTRRTFMSAKYFLLVSCAYSFGAVSFYYFQYLITAPSPPDSIIVLNNLTIRGNGLNEDHNIDLSKKSDQELRDIAIELLMQNEFEKANTVTNWINKKIEWKENLNDKN